MIFLKIVYIQFQRPHINSTTNGELSSEDEPLITNEEQSLDDSMDVQIHHSGSNIDNTSVQIIEEQVQAKKAISFWTALNIPVSIY